MSSGNLSNASPLRTSPLVNSMKHLLALLTLALLFACRTSSTSPSDTDAGAAGKPEVRYYVIGDA